MTEPKPDTGPAASPCSCPYCSHEEELPFPFCEVCGKRVEFCDRCGKPIPAEAKACPDCEPGAGSEE